MADSVDLCVLGELKELLEDAYPVLVERFCEDGQERLTKIVEAVKCEDSELLFTEAHGLKGSSRNMGAGELAEMCGNLEAMGHAKNLASAATIVAALEVEFTAACEIINNY